MTYLLFFIIFLLGCGLDSKSITMGYFQRVDVFALLSGTLRTYQQSGCDDDVVSLKCPPGTSITIELAQYGKSAPRESLCTVKTPPSRVVSSNTSCLWPNAIQTVVEACQKKRRCKFQTSSKTFGGDPCPGVRKYVEVAYKCRPYEFRSKVACQNEKIQLKCNPNSRVAVYSASYGRTEYESIQCPQPQGVREETCLVSYATETVMQLCHGKRSCDLVADVSTFGSPCKPESRMYLKVVYTCVPRKILKDQFGGPLEMDEVDLGTNDYDDDFDRFEIGNEYIRESAASPPVPNVEGIFLDGSTKVVPIETSTKSPPPKTNMLDFPLYQPYTTPRSRSESDRSRYPPMQKTVIKDMLGDDIPEANCTITVKTKVIGFISEWINAYTFVSQNQERVYLYLIVSMAAGLVLLLSILVGRLLVQRHRARRDAKFHATNVSDNTIPNGFTDDISEVDADIDLTSPVPPCPPCPPPSVTIHTPPMGSITEVVRYPHVHSHTLRRPPPLRMEIDTDLDLPRSLSSASNTHFYYG